MEGTTAMELSKLLLKGRKEKSTVMRKQKPEHHLYKLFIFKRTVCLASGVWMGSMMKGKRL